MTMWKRLDDWIGTQVEDHFVMIHLESGRYVSLNDSAAEAWQALETPKDQDAIVSDLTAKFEVDAETCGKSVTALLARMQEMGLVAPVA